MAQGQDPWGELITLGWLRLAEATQNEIWHDRAVQCFNQGTIGVTDGTSLSRGSAARRVARTRASTSPSARRTVSAFGETTTPGW